MSLKRKAELIDYSCTVSSVADEWAELSDGAQTADSTSAGKHHAAKRQCTVVLPDTGKAHPEYRKSTSRHAPVKLLLRPHLDTNYHKDEALQAKFFDIPGVRRLHDALAAEGIPYFLVGGAVLDLICGCTEVKNIDCHLQGVSKERLREFTQKCYEGESQEQPLQPFAVTVRKACSIDAIDLIPFGLHLYDSNFADSDVNALAFHLESGTVVDTFGSGYHNAQQKRFRIPAQSFESWYQAEYPGRINNGKILRLLKMLANGFAFQITDQKDAFVQLCIDKFEDLAAPTIAGLFSTLQVVLGRDIRGDTLHFADPNPGQITVGTDPQKVAKYERCLDSAEKLDSRLVMIRDYMEKGQTQKASTHRSGPYAFLISAGC